MSDCRSTNAFFSSLRDSDLRHPRTQFHDLRLKLCFKLFDLGRDLGIERFQICVVRFLICLRGCQFLPSIGSLILERNESSPISRTFDICASESPASTE